MGEAAALYAIVVLGVSLVAILRKNQRLRASVAELRGNVIDPATGVLVGSALPLRLGPELAWADRLGKQVAIAVFDLYTADPEPAMRTLAAARRAYEPAFRLNPTRVAVAFWDVDRAAAIRAAARIARRVSAQSRSGDVGLGLFPSDGRDIAQLFKIAGDRARPLSEFLTLAESLSATTTATTKTGGERGDDDDDGCGAGVDRGGE